VLPALLGLNPSSPALADLPPAYKLTLGSYHFSSGANALDTNLRWTGDYGNIWGGLYASSQFHEHQFRLGWDHTIALSGVRWSPSLQVASHAYVAGSVNVETGDTWFVGAGLGRTNLRPNTNLNFDPNDAYSLSAGWRDASGLSYALQWIQDNRNNPDQRHLHAVYRTPLPDGQRFTFDVLYKQGLVDGVAIHKIGATLTYDWPRFFVRLAYDPKVNFTADDMTRVSVGTRF
jgi:hypothetical protein